MKRVIDLPTKGLGSNEVSVEGYYVRYSGTPYVSINGSSYKSIYAYSSYL